MKQNHLCFLLKSHLLLHNQFRYCIQNNSANDRVFFIGFMLRYHPASKKKLKLLNDQKLVKSFLQGLNLEAGFHIGIPMKIIRIHMRPKKTLGGGVINTINHELDLIQYFFGEPTLISLTTKSKCWRSRY